MVGAFGGRAAEEITQHSPTGLAMTSKQLTKICGSMVTNICRIAWAGTNTKAPYCLRCRLYQKPAYLDQVPMRLTTRLRQLNQAHEESTPHYQ